MNAPPQHEELRERDTGPHPRPEGHEHQYEHDGDIWSGMGDYRHRFDQLQGEFIEEPRQTVSKAEALAKEAVDQMTRRLNDRLTHIHSELGDGKDDTERMRVAMSHYRRFMDSLANPRAA